MSVLTNNTAPNGGRRKERRRASGKGKQCQPAPNPKQITCNQQAGTNAGTITSLRQITQADNKLSARPTHQQAGTQKSIPQVQLQACTKLRHKPRNSSVTKKPYSTDIMNLKGMTYTGGGYKTSKPLTIAILPLHQNACEY